MNLIDHLNWRYATKKFDPSKKISQEQLQLLKEAIRLSVSSYGLQFYKVLLIENDEIRKELRKVSWNQGQITDASHLFVFCNYTTNHDQHVDDYISRVIGVQGANAEALQNYGSSIKASLRSKSEAELKSWAEKQTYLAMNNLLIACAELRIDACPMEGFDNTGYDRILELTEMGLHAAVIAPVGFRAADDETQHRIKVRKTNEELFETA